MSFHNYANNNNQNPPFNPTQATAIKNTANLAKNAIPDELIDYNTKFQTRFLLAPPALVKPLLFKKLPDN